MKTTILNIFTACGKTYPINDNITLRSINLLSEIIDQNHSLSDPDDFEYEEINMEDIPDNLSPAEFIQKYEQEKQEALQEYQEENESDYSELFDAIETLTDKITEDDFNFDYDGNEYRIIDQNAIWNIYVEEIQNIVEDCYDLKLDDIPSFVAWEIDWEQTAKNAYVDGYGHTFSSYDGSEFDSTGFYIFRTN